VVGGLTNQKRGLGECGGPETSAFNNNETPGKYPEEFLSSLQHGESLKHRDKTCISFSARFGHL